MRPPVPVVTRNTRLNKLAAKWKDAVFLGIKESSGEYFVGTPDGVFRARSIKRKPDEEKYQLDLLNGMRGTPWEMVPSTTATIVEPLLPTAPVPAADDAPPPASKAPAVPVPRQLYIRKDVELAKYGYTEGCLKCTDVREGRPTVAPHSAACRARIEAAIRADPASQSRVDRHDVRFAQGMADQTQQESPPAPTPKRVRQDAGAAGTAGPAANSSPPRTHKPALPASTAPQKVWYDEYTGLPLDPVLV